MSKIDESRKGQHRLIVIAFFVVFIMFFCYTTIWSISYYSKYGNFKRTRAKVIEHVEVDGEIRDKFSYFVSDNEEIEKVSPYKSKYDVGDKFTVYYDKNNEIEVLYKVDAKRVLLPLLTILFGGASIGLFVVYKLTYSNKIKKDT